MIVVANVRTAVVVAFASAVSAISMACAWCGIVSVANATSALLCGPVASEPVAEVEPPGMAMPLDIEPDDLALLELCCAEPPLLPQAARSGLRPPRRRPTECAS